MVKKYCLFIPTLGGGGAERVVALLASYLAKKNNTEVYLVVLRTEGVYWDIVDKKVVIINLNQTRILKSILPLSNWIKENKPNVVFSALSHVNVAASIALQISGHKCRLVMSEHSTVSHIPIFKKKLNKLFFRFFYNKADSIVAVSKGVGDDLIRTLGVSFNKVKVINNPVCPSVRTNEKIDYKDFFKNKPEKIILSIGRLEEEKNYINLLKAFNKLSNKKIALVILGEGKQRSFLENYIADNDLTDRVILLGFVQNPFIWLNSCDLFVSSSEREGFGNAIVEAMAYGLNVVSTDCVGPKEILKDGDFGILVEKNNPQALVEGINELLNFPNKFNKNNILNRAEDFSETKIFKHYDEVL